MTGKRHHTTALALVFALLGAAIGAAAAEKTAKGEDPKRLAAGVEDRTAVALTIYSANLALVKDQRQVSLPAGTFELRFSDVASQIIPSSVQVRSTGAPGGLRVLAQTYEYDLLNPQRLLEKYVGKEVRLYTENPFTERDETVTATLLSAEGGPVFKVDEDITFGHPGRVLFPKVPDSLTSKPTLVWLVENPQAKAQRIEAVYLTNGLTWRADYALTLNDREDRAELAGWATIENNSGAGFADAVIRLVAGDVGRAKEDPQVRAKALSMEGAAPKAAAPVREEDFFEYHIYSLQRPATLKNKQTQQISLVAGDSVPVRKELVFFGARQHYLNRYPELGSTLKAAVMVEFQNRRESNLGFPLPKGVVRVFKPDGEGALQFAGEAAIDHTPRDETVRIKVGSAVDVVANRRQTDWKKLAADTYEAAFEIGIRNQKKEDVTVKVVEPIPGAWTLLNATHEFKKTGANTAEVSLAVPKGKEVKLAYTAKIRF